jgi:hypothetical protein
MAQPIFITIKNMTVTIAKSSPKFWAKPEIFKKLPKVNNHPTSENTSNLVALPVTQNSRQ